MTSQLIKIISGVLILFLSFQISLFAQEGFSLTVEEGAEFKSKEKNPPLKTFTNSKGEVFVVSQKPSVLVKHSLKKFDSQLNLISELDLDDLLNHEFKRFYLDLLQSKDKLFLVSVWFDKESSMRSIYAQELNQVDISKSESPKLVHSYKVSDMTARFAYHSTIFSRISRDQSKILLFWSDIEFQDDFSSTMVSVLDNNLDEIYSKKVVPANIAIFHRFDDFIIDNDGNVFALTFKTVKHEKKNPSLSNNSKYVLRRISAEDNHDVIVDNDFSNGKRCGLELFDMGNGKISAFGMSLNETKEEELIYIILDGKDLENKNISIKKLGSKILFNISYNNVKTSNVLEGWSPDLYNSFYTKYCQKLSDDEWIYVSQNTLHYMNQSAGSSSTEHNFGFYNIFVSRVIKNEIVSIQEIKNAQVYNHELQEKGSYCPIISANNMAILFNDHPKNYPNYELEKFELLDGSKSYISMIQFKGSKMSSRKSLFEFDDSSKESIIPTSLVRVSEGEYIFQKQYSSSAKLIRVKLD